MIVPVLAEEPPDAASMVCSVLWVVWDTVRLVKVSVVTEVVTLPLVTV